MSRFLFVTTLLLMTLNLIFLSLRLVLDILGNMWLSAAMNISDVIFTLIAVYGTVSRKVWPLVLLLLWCCFLWIPWNVLLILTYQNIINFSLFYSVFTMGVPNSFSWWYSHGLSCSIPSSLRLILEKIPSDELLQQRDNAASLFGLQSATPGRKPNFPQNYHVFKKIVSKKLHLTDLLIWFQPSNQSTHGLCWPDFRLVESIQSFFHIFLTTLLCFASIFLLVRIQRSKKLVICDGDFTFVAMPRGYRSEKNSLVSTRPFFSKESGASRPLLSDFNDRSNHPSVIGGIKSVERDSSHRLNCSHQKFDSATATQSTTSDQIHDTEYSTGPESNSIPGSRNAILIPDASTSFSHKILSRATPNSPVFGSNTSSDIWGVQPTTTSLHREPYRSNVAIGSHKTSPSLSTSIQVISSDRCTTSISPHQGTLGSDKFASSHRKRNNRDQYPSFSSLTSHEPGSGSLSKQLTQLQEYSRRIAQITATRTPSSSTFAHNKPEYSKITMESHNNQLFPNPQNMSNRVILPNNDKFRDPIQPITSDPVDLLHFRQQSALVTQFAKNRSNLNT